jgi:hypothetical protein
MNGGFFKMSFVLYKSPIKYGLYEKNSIIRKGEKESDNRITTKRIKKGTQAKLRINTPKKD